MTTKRLRNKKRIARGFQLQRACIFAMLFVGVVVLYLRAPTFTLEKQLDEISQRFLSSLRSRPTTDNDGRATTTHGGSVVIDMRDTEVSAVRDSDDEFDVVIERLTWSYYAMYACFGVLLLFYFPFVVSVYWSTIPGSLVARLSSLAFIPIPILLPCIAVESNHSAGLVNPARLVGLFAFSYPFLILFVVFLVFRSHRFGRFGVPLVLLGAAPLVLFVSIYIQSRVASAVALQYGLSTVAAVVVAGCALPYCRFVSHCSRHSSAARTT